MITQLLSISFSLRDNTAVKASKKVSFENFFGMEKSHWRIQVGVIIMHMFKYIPVNFCKDICKDFFNCWLQFTHHFNNSFKRILPCKLELKNMLKVFFGCRKRPERQQPLALGLTSCRWTSVIWSGLWLVWGMCALQPLKGSSESSLSPIWAGIPAI